MLAEKNVECDTVAIDLDNRPAWLLELNPPKGRVPVLEEDTFVLPESVVIMEYLEERYPEPALLPADPAERALARLVIERFDDLGDPYYDLYWKRPGASPQRLADALAALERRLESYPYLGGRSYGLADIAYVPWILRAESRLGFDLGPYGALADWLGRLLERPAIAAERHVVLAL